MVKPGIRVWHSGHSFERVALADEPVNDGRDWIHRAPESDAAPQPANLTLFESDKTGRATFALWGRVVVHGSEAIGYSGPDNTIHLLGSTSLLQAEVSAPEDASQLLGVSAAGDLVQGGGEA